MDLVQLLDVYEDEEEEERGGSGEAVRDAAQAEPSGRHGTETGDKSGDGNDSRRGSRGGDERQHDSSHSDRIVSKHDRQARDARQVGEHSERQCNRDGHRHRRHHTRERRRERSRSRSRERRRSRRSRSRSRDRSHARGRSASSDHARRRRYSRERSAAAAPAPAAPLAAALPAQPPTAEQLLSIQQAAAAAVRAMQGGPAGVMTVEQKRKLLWGHKKPAVAQATDPATAASAAFGANRWDAAALHGDAVDKARFLQLMGVKRDEVALPAVGPLAQLDPCAAGRTAMAGEEQTAVLRELEGSYSAARRRVDGARTLGLGL